MRLGDTEGLGGGGMHCPFLPPQNPREGRPGLISLSTPPPPAVDCSGAPRLTSLRYADLCSLTPFPPGSGREAAAAGRGGTPPLPRPPPPKSLGSPPRTAPASLPAPRVSVGTGPGF